MDVSDSPVYYIHYVASSVSQYFSLSQSPWIYYNHTRSLCT